MHNKLVFVFLLFAPHLWSQVNSAIVAETDSIMGNRIINNACLAGFYEKLQALKAGTSSKINIVHIGDSHIQADLMTNAARQKLQQTFGNGGRGFVFPHNLAKTNGSSDIRFSSDDNWKSLRNIYPPTDFRIGLSGIGLESDTKDFTIELKVKDTSYDFNTIKIISPEPGAFAVATNKVGISTEIESPKVLSHKIKRGDALSLIASKYNTTVSELKRANNLRSNAIQAGKVLKIPTSATERRTVQHFDYVPLIMKKDSMFSSYHTQTAMNQIFIIASSADNFNLSGVVLEKDAAGVVYHNIGVNGAKFSDYNKHPLFFEQLTVLNPDLIVLSLGTNESFDKMVSADYAAQLKIFIANVRAQNPRAAILISTPPPSQFQRKNINQFVVDYTHDIIAHSATNNFAVWDLFALLGGTQGVRTNAHNGIIGPDRVHYTKLGYELQGRWLAQAIINGYQSK